MFLIWLKSKPWETCFFGQEVLASSLKEMEAPSWELGEIDMGQIFCSPDGSGSLWGSRSGFLLQHLSENEKKNTSSGSAGYWSGFCFICRPCVRHTLVSPQVSSFPLSTEGGEQGCTKSVIHLPPPEIFSANESWDTSQSVSPSRSHPGVSETAFTAPTA